MFERVQPMLIARKRLLPLLVFITGLGVAYVLLVAKPQPQAGVPEPLPTPTVSVVRAMPASVRISVSTQGTVQPRREINMVSQVTGLVERVAPHFADGGFFDAGSELVKVEDADYRFAETRARARVADATQRVAQEKGHGRQAAREWRDLGNAEANQLFLRKPQLAGVEAALRAAQADLAEAQLNLRRTSIRAPFNGRVSEKFVDVGQYIAAGTPVARVYGTDVVEVRLPLTDRQVALLELPLNYQDRSTAGPGGRVRLHARFADREWQWQGRVVRTDASIDVDSRVVYAVAEIQEPFAQDPTSERPPLGIGLFVEAEIEGRALSGVSVLPRSSLRNDGSVLLVDAGQRLRRREVRLLQSNGRQVWLQGLVPGERVVTSQLALPVEGMRVAVSPAEALVEVAP